MATTISRDDALHLAQLSNIQLTDEELATLQTDLGTILDYINELGELDTTGVEPTYQVTDLQNVMRDDVVSIHSDDREALLKLAPEKADNSIKVPKVL
jgi:aspartyl-tRNA(Asn)/glutamyl-tRNA(Gln) amidotransferase subunit C